VQDFIIVGGGHNGLTCAAYLAKAGKSVTLLEANSQVGGFVLTQEIPGAPGYRMNPYAIEFPFARAEPSVTKELDLARFGLQWAAPDPHQTHMMADGVTFSLYHDLDKTCESIARVSNKDAEYYAQMMGALMKTMDTALPYLQDHPTRPSPRTVAKILGRAIKNRNSLLPGLRFIMSAPTEILQGFESEEIKAFLAMNVATGAFRPLDEPLNTTALVYFATMHLFPLQRPIGGSGAFCEAIAAAARSYGANIRTSAPVRQIVVTNGKATGVVLANGEHLSAKTVVSAADPVSLFTKLLDKKDVPDEVSRDINAMQVTANGVSHFKADIAVSERPKFLKPEITEANVGGGMSFAPSFAHTDRTFKAILNGDLLDEHPFFYIATPSVLDRTMVPSGSKGESIFIWVGAVPHTFADGRQWSEVKEKFYDNVIDHLETFAPGLRDTIIGKHIAAPGDFNEPWVYKGSARGVDVVPSQAGPWRPSPTLASYRTPIDSLWHTGHGTHPMSGTSGWPGRIAARTILKRT
jgi:beta-carotene ketolase (CrtO type)